MKTHSPRPEMEPTTLLSRGCAARQRDHINQPITEHHAPQRGYSSPRRISDSLPQGALQKTPLDFLSLFPPPQIKFLVNICFLLQHERLANAQVYLQGKGCSGNSQAGLWPRHLGSGKMSSPSHPRPPSGIAREAASTSAVQSQPLACLESALNSQFIIAMPSIVPAQERVTSTSLLSSPVKTKT